MDIFIKGMNGCDFGGEAGGKGDNFVSGFKDAAGDASGEAPEVMVFVALGADDPLDGKAGIDVVGVAADVDGLECIEKGGAPVPIHFLRAFYHIIAMESADGDKPDVRDLDAGGEVFEIGNDFVEDVFFVFDEVHFVNADNDVLDVEEGGDKGVATGLFDDAVACVDEDDGEISGGCAGDHVSGVLDMAGGVGDDEFPAWSGKVAIGNVYGDALFTFSAETIGEEREVHVGVSTLLATFLNSFELVFENSFGVVEKASDEGAFSVVHASGGGETEEVHVEVGVGH